MFHVKHIKIKLNRFTLNRLQKNKMKVGMNMKNEIMMLNEIMYVYSELKTSLYTMSQVIDDCDEIAWCEINLNNRDLVTIDINYKNIAINIDCGDTYNCNDNGMCEIKYVGEKCTMYYAPSKFNDLPSRIIELFMQTIEND